MKIKNIILLMIIPIIIGIIVYQGGFIHKSELIKESSNIYVGNKDNAIGNCIAICRNNGFNTFPVLIGGDVSILDIEKKKLYRISNNKSFLGGYINPIIYKNNIYYEEAYDGSGQGNYFRTNINSKKKDDLGFSYNAPFYIMNEQVYYMKEAGIDGDSFCIGLFDIKTNQSIVLIDDNITNFTVSKNYLYFICKKDNKLYKYDFLSKEKKCVSADIKKYNIIEMQVDDQENIFLQTDREGIVKLNRNSNELTKIVLKNTNTITEPYDSKIIHLDNENLYYINNGIYRKNLITGKVELVLEISKINFLELSDIEFKESSNKISWCDDYIVIQTSAIRNERWKCGIIAYDYNGNEVYRNENLKFNL